jgi:hypothetical protein
VLSHEELKSQAWEHFVNAVDKVRDLHPPTEHELASRWDVLDNLQNETGLNAGSAKVDGEEIEVAWPLIHTARTTGEWEPIVSRLVSLSHQHANQVVWPVIQQWLEDDFEAATNWVAALPPGKQRDDVIGVMNYDSHGDRHECCFDRERLWDWIHEVSPNKIDSAVFWADDLAAISRWLQKHPETTPDLESARRTFAAKLAEVDNKAAIAWAQTFASPESALRKIGRYWFRPEPWAATQWAQESLGWTEEECAKNFGPLQ